MLTDVGTARVRLDGDVLGVQADAGEAAFVPAGVPATLSATVPTTVALIGIESGSGDVSFAPGLRDVDLVRDVLATGQTLELSVGVPRSFGWGPAPSRSRTAPHWAPARLLSCPPAS